MRKILLMLIFPLFLCAGNISQSPIASTVDVETTRERFKDIDRSMKIFKNFQYSMGSDIIDILLLETQDRPFNDYILSSKIRAIIAKTDMNNTTTIINSIIDFPTREEAGVQFWSKLCEFTDIDGDGYIDPIIVYRFYIHQTATTIDDDDYRGRLKIVVFYKNTKAVIRAVTGELDNERSTIANSAYFYLPLKIRAYIVNKMTFMYKNHNFGFDNSHNFVPRKEK